MPPTVRVCILHLPSVRREIDDLLWLADMLLTAGVTEGDPRLRAIEGEVEARVNLLFETIPE